MVLKAGVSMIKDWYKKWQVWLGVAVALLLILGCALGFSAASTRTTAKLQ